MKRGFTLIEITFALIIIGLLLSMFISRVMGSYRASYDIARKQHLLTLSNAITSAWYDDRTLMTGSACSDEIMDIFDGKTLMKMHQLNDPRGIEMEVDECKGQYKFIPFDNDAGGIIVAQVESRQSATFTYGGGYTQIDRQIALNNICYKKDCGDAPWYHAVFVARSD